MKEQLIDKAQEIEDLGFEIENEGEWDWTRVMFVGVWKIEVDPWFGVFVHRTDIDVDHIEVNCESVYDIESVINFFSASDIKVTPKMKEAEDAVLHYRKKNGRPPTY